MVDFMKNRAPTNSRVRQALRSGLLAVSAVTAYELYFGEPDGPGKEALDQLIDAIFVAPLTREASALAGERGAALAASGMRLATPDLLIAGTALLAGAPLITRNVRHFGRVDGLLLLGPAVT
jgi:predicted nucleic acid-binding protein